MISIVISACKKTPYFESLSQESSKYKAFEVLKIKEFTSVNGCFQNESNAVFGVFLQRLISLCKKATLIILVFFSFIALSRAQSSIYHFDIESYALQVKEKNTELKIAAEQKRHGQKAKNDAFAALLPQLNFQGTYQRNFNDQNMYIEFPDFSDINPETGEIPIRLQKFAVGFDNDFQANLLLEQSILSIKSLYELKTSFIYSDIEGLKFISAMNGIIGHARKIFLQAVLMEHVYNLNKLVEKNAHKNYLAAKNKFNNKIISEIEYLQAKIRWENEIPKTKQARRNYNLLLGNLKIIAGVNAADSVVLEYQFSFVDDVPEAISFSNILALREDYQMLEKNTELQKATVRKELSECLPVLSGKLGYSYLSNSNKWRFDEHVNKPYYAGLTLTMPIISGGYRNSQIQKAKIQKQISELQKYDAEHKIQIQIRDLQMKLSEEAGIIKSASSTLSTAKKGYELAKKNADNGLISQIDLSRYSEDYKRAQLNYYNAVYNFECSKIDFNLAIGKNE